MSQRNSGYARQPHDLYETPAWVTQALAEHLRLPTSAPIWEPAAGRGAMVRALEASGYTNVTGTDISAGFDFLKDWPNWPITSIITNPPFWLAEQFVKRALDLTEPFGGLTAMLLRVDFDSAVTRRPIFSECPAFAGKLVLTRRIKWFDGPKSPSENHCWFIWRWGHEGAPTIAYFNANRSACKVKAET
jgi:hypothetical protein